MALSTEQLRVAWGPPCSGTKVTVTLNGSGVVHVRAAIVDAVKALDVVLRKYGYRTRKADTGAYNCRMIAGTNRHSLHAYAVALDINWNCVSGDTEIITWDGIKRISDVAGTKQRLLSRDPFTGGAARWIDAPILAHGTAPVFDVQLSRRGVNHTIRTTANHRWFTVHRFSQSRSRWRNVEAATSDLAPGNRILGCLPAGAETTNLSSAGVAAGIVYGDGSKNRNRQSQVSLFGAKHELLRFFAEPNVHDEPTPAGVPGVRVMDLPSYWKDAPPLDESAAYLLGWLAGYFATDGSVGRNGTPSITAAARSDLDLFRLVAMRVGIACSEPTGRLREGFGTVSEKWSMTLLPSTVPEHFFVRSDQHERFVAKERRPSDHLWKVESVTPAGSEEVFCPSVPDTESFALEGWILTGNSNPMRKPLTTDMPRAMVAEIEAIRTNSGAQVWRWGGHFSTPDAMHYEICCSPRDIASGIRGQRPAPQPQPQPKPQPEPEPQLEVEEDDMAQIIRRTKTGGYYTVTATHIRPWPGATRTLMEGLAKLSGEPLKVTDIAEEHWAAFTGNLQDTRTGKKFEP